MAYEFRLDLSKANGEKFDEVTDFIDLACSVRVNEPGAMSFVLPGNHTAAYLLEERSQLDLYYRDLEAGLAWTKFFGGIYLGQRREYSGQSRFVGSAMGYLWMLGTRIVAYSANKTGRSKYVNVAGETVMKSLVQYNVTAAATTLNGRLRNGTAWPSNVITIESTQHRGNTTTWYAAQDNVLESLIDLAKIAGGDYDLVKNQGAFQFRFYPGQLGTDRTSTVVFSLEHGNMGSAVYKRSRVSEATVAIVGGQGDEAAREFVVRTGADYNSMSDVEVFAPATHIEQGNVNGLNAAGDKKLVDTRAPAVFEFDIIQTPSSRFGLHYFLGDKASAVNPYTQATLVQKVVAADAVLSTGNPPEIKVYAETP